MAVYCWGNTVHGELGLGGIENEQILVPQELTWIGAPDLVQAACGYSHTLLLTKDGKVYSCGNNDHGQLGHEMSRKRPQLIALLDNYSIMQVSCGASHSLALSEWGQIFSWGSDSIGQLGQDNGLLSQPCPKVIKSLATKQVVQVVSGHYHCLALTNSGELYSWGANGYGQLGLGHFCEKITKPTEITSLAGIPLASISCGGNHCFAISKSGAVFGWGKNTFGQLGLNDDVSKAYPQQLRTLRSLGVRYISCGEDFSVFLTMDGGVFTCGAGTYGQLGHGSSGNEILPRMVMELMGSTITQISCGSRHTLALVASRGRVYAFGLGGSGQLGARSTNNSLVPQVVLGPWVSPSGSALINSDNNEKNSYNSSMIVKTIFSGGDHCLVSATQHFKKIPPDDCRIYTNKSQILFLTVELSKTCSLVPNDKTIDLDLLSSVESIFKSQACINSSFLLRNDQHFCCNGKNHGVNINEAQAAFDLLRKIENDSLKQIIWDCIVTDLFLTLSRKQVDPETLRVFLIIPLYHEFVNSKHYSKLHTPFSKAVFGLCENGRKILTKWWASTPIEYFENLIGNYKAVVLYIINFNFNNRLGEDKRNIRYEANLDQALKTLLLFYCINHRDRVQKIPYDSFHIPELNEFVDIQLDYLNWIMHDKIKPSNPFYFCSYPFVFDAHAKTTLLQTDQAIQMQSAIQNSANHSLLQMFAGCQTATISQFVVLDVARARLVEDAITEIQKYPTSELKKPLKIKFKNEEGEDAGGVRKEFFLLLIKELLDAKYGMFKEFEDSRAIWFNDASFEESNNYELIGIVCGLAIYNFTIINLPFPLALYKKILNEPVDLTDLRDLSPTLANSMKSILDYEGDDMETVFDIKFEITRNVFDEMTVIPLKPNGESISVTQENKKEFVNLYIDYIFNKSVDKKFSSFKKGFLKVCGGRVLELFRPHELMAVIVGNEDYDWQTFETEAEYKEGISSSDQVVRWFWELFHELSESEKRNFLLFLTGSDRIPIQGMKAIKIIFVPVYDEKRLPVAHTCFNTFDLPKYSTKERLKYKLQQALQETSGFSLV